MATALKDYDPELYDIALTDPRAHVETFYTSNAGSIVTVTNGTVSAVSSILVLCIIFRSPKGLDSVYHRIITGLTLFNLMYSVAIAFNTLPMPSDMIYQQFEGLVMGNTSSCTAQGFFAFLGGTGSTLSCASLLIYYLHSIRYKKSDIQISKCLEPCLHAVSLIVVFGLSLSLLAFHAYNPTPLDAWCTAIVYPWWCTNERDRPCLIRGARESYVVYFILLSVSIIMGLTMCASLILLVLEIRSKRNIMKMQLKQVQDSALAPTKLIIEEIRHHEKILSQCIIYLIVYFVTLFFPFYMMIHGTDRSSNSVIPVLHLIIRPLQGFFHMLIFVHHKVFNLRQVHGDLSLCRSLAMVLSAGEDPELIIQSLTILEDDTMEDHIGNPHNYAFNDPIEQSKEEIGSRSAGGVSKFAVESMDLMNLSLDCSEIYRSAGLSKDLSGFDISYQSDVTTSGP